MMAASWSEETEVASEALFRIPPVADGAPVTPSEPIDNGATWLNKPLFLTNQPGNTIAERTMNSLLVRREACQLSLVKADTSL